MLFFKLPKAIAFIILLLLSNLLIAQDRIITGTVRSEDGLLPGVNVLVMGTTYGTVTDLDGKFTMSLTDSEVTLIFSFVGYETVSEAVGNRSVIDVFMKMDAKQLETVVVTGYATQAVKNFSGAIEVVDVESAKTVPTSNVSVQLQGRAPGVMVLNSGELGKPVSVRIRGFSTINDNDPLYIIDGAPADQATVEMLNPYDIESAQVLKDASAASIYGARAANGVIIYTTKKGKGNDKTNITFEGFVGVQYVNDHPEMCTPTEVAYVSRLGRENAGMPLDDHEQYSLYDSLGNFVEWGLPDYLIPAGYSIEHMGPLDTTDYDFESQDKAYTLANKEGTNWIDQVYQPALIQNYNLTLTSGSEKGQFALTLGYFDQEGVVIHSSYKKYTLRINTLFNVKNRLRIGETLGISFHRDQPYGFSGGSYGQAEIQPVYDIKGNYTGTKIIRIGDSNPVASTEREKDNYNYYMRLLGSIFLELDILRDLTFKTSFSPNLKVTFEDKQFLPRMPENEQSDMNSLRQRSYNSFNWTWYNTLIYSKLFAEKHNLDILVGTEAIEDNTTWFGTYIADFYSDDLSYRQLDVGEQFPGVEGNKSEWSMFSIFAKVDYNFRGKYILSGTVRRDGSSRFGTGNKYGVFPAFSAAWRISGENFMRNVNFINDLKLRFGWGQTGNQNIGNYRILNTYSANAMTAAYSITGAQNEAEVGIESSVFGNPNTKWETSTTTNAGIDLTLLDNRINLTLDWYTRGTKDMLMQISTNALIGQAAAPYDNIGEMKNTGLDFSINYNSAPDKDFTWNAGINFTHYKNEVTKLYNPEQIFYGGAEQVTMEGQPIASYFGLNVLGIFQDTTEVERSPYQEGAAPGRWKFDDTNGNDSIDNIGNPHLDDRIILGSPHPDFTFGIPMNFNYKGIFLNLFWYGSFGNEAINNEKVGDFLVVGYFENNQFGKGILESWGMPGVDNSKAVIPQVNVNSRYTAPLESYSQNSFYIEDGSFVRLNQLILGYDFKVANWKSIEQFRIYFQGNNLFTFTNYQGGDPGMVNVENFDLSYEFVNDFGVGSGSGERLPKSFLVGVNITL
jgi:TonB-linked SusC/RagA family outer membrane protein